MHDGRVHPTVQRVVDAAGAAGLQIEPVEFPEGTRTAADAAAAIGVAVGQIVKSLVFVLEGEIVLALVSGANQLDPLALAHAAAAPGSAVGRADAAAVRDATGFAIGGIPPFGHDGSLPTYCDEDLEQYDVVWAAAGTPHHVFAIAPADLVRASGAAVAPLAAAPQPGQ
jgi:prolyl-tRNA editing enzyme YbaK/EbsC (Cys-tRNA(Pro) deacylase)